MNAFHVEFPDFPRDAFPSLPDGFEDSSWHNDTCPSMIHEWLNLQIFVDYPDATMREMKDTKRYCMMLLRTPMPKDGESPVDGFIMCSDDWRDVLRRVGAVTIAALTDEYQAWCKARDIPPMSADELACDEDQMGALDNCDIEWVNLFIQRWEAAEGMANG